MEFPYVQYIINVIIGLTILGTKVKSECNATVTYYGSSNLKDTVIIDNAIWSNEGLRSATMCARDCLGDKNCVSFFYNSISDKCTAHGVQLLQDQPSVPDVGSRYYTLPIRKLYPLNGHFCV